MTASLNRPAVRGGALAQRVERALSSPHARIRPVVCVGHSAYDITWIVDALPAGGGKQRASAFHEGGGGMAANAAVTVQRLGGHAHFWGRGGDDRIGHAMRDELSADGVDVSCLRLFEGAHSSVSGIVVDRHGERSIFNFRGEGLLDDPGWLPLERIANAAAVLADPRWPDAAAAAFRAARESGVPTILDGDVAEPGVLSALLPWVDFAIFSEPGLAAFASADDTEAGLARALERGARVAAVTQGARGMCRIEDGRLQRIPSFAVDVVDTTGSGDAFHGAATFALGNGLTAADAFAFASAVAALKCRQRGGRAGLPDLATAIAFLAASTE